MGAEDVDINFTTQEGVRHFAAYSCGSWSHADTLLGRARAQVLDGGKLCAVHGSVAEGMVEAKCGGSDNELYTVSVHFEAAGARALRLRGWWLQGYRTPGVCWEAGIGSMAGNSRQEAGERLMEQGRAGSCGVVRANWKHVASDAAPCWPNLSRFAKAAHAGLAGTLACARAPADGATHANWAKPSCSCPWAEGHGGLCKHSLALMLAQLDPVKCKAAAARSKPVPAPPKAAGRGRAPAAGSPAAAASEAAAGGAVAGAETEPSAASKPGRRKLPSIFTTATQQ